MNIVLTGANGFIASNWLARLAPKARVFALGRKAPTGARAGVEIVHVPCDLAKPGALAGVIASGALPEKVDDVVHLAVSRLHRTFPETALDLFTPLDARSDWAVAIARDDGVHPPAGGYALMAKAIAAWPDWQKLLADTP